MQRAHMLMPAAFFVLLSACSSAGTPANAVSVSLPGGGSALTLTGIGSSAVVSASESGYTGTFGAFSSNTGIASIAPWLVQAGARKHTALRIDAAGGSSFTVTAVAAGSTQISVGDQFGNATHFSVTVVSPTTSPSPSPSPTASPTPAPGAIALTPSALSFTAAGAGFAQTVNASETNYSGSFTATTPAAGQTNSCSGIAAISPSSGTSFAVTPAAAGHCTYAIAGAAGQSATLTIDVTTTTVGGS